MGIKNPITEKEKTPTPKFRKSISQADIPNYPLNKAIRVATAIFENYGKDPTKPLRVAQAMNMSPSSGPFRSLAGSSVAYGLTDGGYAAPVITLTQLAKRILSPTSEFDDLRAKKEAILKPRIINEFLNKYNNSPLPIEKIALNVLEEMGVPRDRTKKTFDLIIESANEVGFLSEIKGKTYVDLQGAEIKSNTSNQDDEELKEENVDPSPEIKKMQEPIDNVQTGIAALNKKVFITHGKNQTFLEPIKKLLSFGGFEAVIATDKQTVSQPVPEKVMEAMRGCGAAIIHIDAEQKVIDQEAKEHVMLNPNVLIEIGAAMALYGKRFILLVKDGIELPSNLQGLYEVRYTGEKLDSDVTIKLLEAINDIKNHQVPK